MLYVVNNSINPYYNLALEEYLLRQDIGSDIFLLWRNSPSVIIGKFQNTIEEVNENFIKENNIHVVRRMSGGGAVYHDLGNINFTFIIKGNKKLFDFNAFTQPVIKTLEQIGIKAEFNGRNDLTIDGRKFSGNSQYITKGNLLHHGTILFNTNLDKLEKSLNVNNDKIESKGIKSVRSRVTNIKEHLEDNIEASKFKSLLLKHIYKDQELSTYDLKGRENQEIEKLMKEKYCTWEWNYGKSPEYNIKSSHRFKGGKIEVRLNIQKGYIRECKIYGDFLGTRNIEDVEEKLINNKYNKETVSSILKDIDIKQYFGQITLDELISFFNSN